MSKWMEAPHHTPVLVFAAAPVRGICSSAALGPVVTVGLSSFSLMHRKKNPVSYKA